MNGLIKTIILTGATCTLAACSACPKTGDYNRVPYVESERGTAGEGVAIYDGKCREARKSMVKQERVTPGKAKVRKAEPVFRDGMRK